MDSREDEFDETGDMEGNSYRKPPQKKWKLSEDTEDLEEEEAKRGSQ